MANTEMFKRVLKQIELEPTSFNMDSWQTTEEDYQRDVREVGDYDISIYDPSEGFIDVPASECGTTRCVAGWAIHFKALDEGIDTDYSDSLLGVMDALAKKMGVRPTFEVVGKTILEIDDSSLFWACDDDAYRIVKEYAEGERG